MKKIIIAGGKGFLGKQLERYFEDKSYQIKILTRKPSASHHILWDGKTKGEWVQELENSHVLINLCGKSVDCRYTAKNRREILRSRIASTCVLQSAINDCTHPPKIWLNASSATIYIHAESDIMTEARGIIGDDFSMTICKKWEHEFFKETSTQTRKLALRTSIVMGREGGAFPKLKTITRMGLGGRQGSGFQFISWIHALDFCRAVHFVIEKTHLSGPINITAPNSINNEEFMSEVRKALHIPFGIPLSKVLLEIAAVFLRTETELLLKSRNVYPEKLIIAGFEFDFPEVSEAINELVQNTTGKRSAWLIDSK